MRLSAAAVAFSLAALAPSLAAAQRSDVRIDLHVELSEAVLGEPLTVRARVPRAPEGVVHAIRVRAYALDAQAFEVIRPGLGPVEVEVPGSAWTGAPLIEIFIDALDARGQMIHRARRLVQGRVPADPVVEPPVERGPELAMILDEENRLEEPLFWVLVGSAVAIGIATMIAVLVADAERGVDFGAPRVVFP